MQISDHRVEPIDLDKLTAYISDMREILKESNLSEKRSFIQSLIKEMKIQDNKALLTYSPPLPLDNITLTVETVPRFVNYGGRYCTISRTFELAFSLAV